MNRHASRKKESYLFVKQPTKSAGKTWKKKWVAVCQNKSSSGKSVLLELYVERNAYHKPVISLLIEGVDSVARIPTKIREHAFDIKSGERTLLSVATDSESQTYEWLETFHRLLLPVKPELTSLPQIGEDFCKVSIIPNKASDRLGLLGDYFAATNEQMKVSLYDIHTGEVKIHWDMHHLKKVLVTTKCNIRDKEKIMYMVVSDRSKHGKGELMFFSQKAQRLADTIFQTLSGAISVKSRQTRSASMVFEITPKDLKRMMQQRDPDSESVASVSMDGIKYGIEEEKVTSIPEEIEEIEEIEQEEGDWVIVHKTAKTVTDENEGGIKESSDTVESEDVTPDAKTDDVDVTLQNEDLELDESVDLTIVGLSPALQDNEDSKDAHLESKECDIANTEQVADKIQATSCEDIFIDIAGTDNKEQKQTKSEHEQPDVVLNDEDINSLPFPDVVSSQEGSTNRQLDNNAVVGSPQKITEIENIFDTPVYDTTEGGQVTDDLENSVVLPDVKDLTKGIHLDANHPAHTHDVSTDSGFINDTGEDVHIMSINKNNNNSRESLNCVTEEDTDGPKDGVDTSIDSCHEDVDDKKDNERMQADVLPEFGLPVDVADLEEISVIVYNDDSPEVLV